MSYQSRRLKYDLLIALGASRTLRRKWLRGCVLAIAGCVIGFAMLAPFERIVLVQMAMYGLWLGFFAGIGGLGTWLLACLIGYTGKQLDEDRTNKRLFK